jgi:hypothetical protein
MKITIYEDNERLSQLLCMLIEATESMHLLSSYGDCLEALHNTQVQRPDVISFRM